MHMIQKPHKLTGNGGGGGERRDGDIPESYLVVFCNKRKLLGLQKLCLGDSQPIFSIEKLNHAAITVSHSQVIMNYQPFQMFYDTPV